MNKLLLEKIANTYGTPSYVYDIARLRKNIDFFLRHAKDGRSMVAVAMKANSNFHLWQEISRAGLGADAVSIGEILLALKAGIAPGKIIFSGVGKTHRELEFAITKGIRFINVESEEELEMIAGIVEEKSLKVDISFRLNPDIAIESNPKISTGGLQHKFGCSLESVLKMCEAYRSSEHIRVGAIHAHIGSQVHDPKSYSELKLFFAECIPLIQSTLGYALTAINFGGGFGIDEHGNVGDWIEDWMREAIDFAQANGCLAIFEPGRSLFANVGVLLTTVIRTKEIQGKKFVVVDAAMNDFMRTALYGAIHKIICLDDGGEGQSSFDIVGPVCESTDTFVYNAPLPSGLKARDLLYLDQAGAYGFSMSSQYNMRCRAAEVLVDADDNLKLSRRRETFDDLMMTTEGD